MLSHLHLRIIVAHFSQFWFVHFHRCSGFEIFTHRRSKTYTFGWGRQNNPRENVKQGHINNGFHYVFISVNWAGVWLHLRCICSRFRTIRTPIGFLIPSFVPFLLLKFYSVFAFVVGVLFTIYLLCISFIFLWGNRSEQWHCLAIHPGCISIVQCYHLFCCLTMPNKVACTVYTFVLNMKRQLGKVPKAWSKTKQNQSQRVKLKHELCALCTKCVSSIILAVFFYFVANSFQEHGIFCNLHTTK